MCLLATVVAYGGPATPAHALPPGPTCTVAITGDGEGQCLYLVPLGAGGLTVTAAAGVTATAAVVCTVGSATVTVLGPGIGTAAMPVRAGLCVVELVTVGPGLGTAFGF